MTDRAEILLVDDSEDDRLLFKRAVDESGLNAHVTLAIDAAQAVIRLNRLGKYGGLPLPDLIVLDLDLPGLQGKTILQIIRNAYGKDFIPVVILTGSESTVDREACEAMESSDFMRKPTSYGELIVLVMSLARFLPKQPPNLNADKPSGCNVKPLP
jgi:CheY-like chemotaxis protein